MPDDLTRTAGMRRQASLAPSTWNAEARTLDVIWSTGAAVERRDYATGRTYSELLSLTGADLARLNAGAPVLDTHSSFSVGDVLGAVVPGSARIVGGQGVATIALTADPAHAGIVANVGAGVLRNLSVGYVVQEWATETMPDGAELRTATKWTPFEISLVPVPADAGAQVRAAPTPEKDTYMPNPTETVAPELPPAVLAERQRITDIRGAARAAGLADDWTDRHIAANTAPDVARAEALAHVSSTGTRRVHPAMQIGESNDDPATLSRRMGDAIVHRVAGGALPDHAREFRGMPLAGMAAALLDARGERGLRYASPAAIVARSLATGDFPNLLGSVSDRILQNALAVAPGAARVCCAIREVPDFRSGKFLQAAGVLNLALLAEGGEIQHSPPFERGESYQVQTFARNVAFTRQALVNDDLGAFDQMRLFGAAIVATEATAFAAMFGTNGGGWGPTLTDGNPLFHSTHGNVGSGAMGTTGISAGRVVLRAQTDAAGNLVAPEPRILLTGPAGETSAEQALNQLVSVATTESNVPVFAGRLTLAVEPRLAGAPWFLFADPAVSPVLALVTLAGTGGMPQITQHDQANMDGLTFKVLHDFTIAPMSFVGAVRLTGS